MAEGTIKIKVEADSSDAEKNIESLKSDVEETGEAASSTGDGAFDKLKSAASTAASTIAKTLTAAVTALGTTITAVGTKAVEEYAEYEQMVGGIETLYGDAADTVMAYAEDAFSAAGLSANEYMEQATTYAAALVSSLGDDTAAAAEYANMAIEDMSDNANKMGTDMEDLENAYEGFSKANYTMLDNLKLGYAGTSEGMQELIDDANELKEANGEMGDLTIDSYADIVEAIHLVQTEMGITGTTAEEAATTISGSISTLEAAWDNWLVGLADDNADMAELTEDLITSLENVVNNLAPVIAEIAETAVDCVGDALTQAVAAIEPALAEALTGIWNNVASLVSSWTGLELPQFDTSQVEAGLDALVTVVGNVWDSIWAVVGSVVETISGVVDAVYPIIEEFVSTLQSMGVGEAFSAIGEALLDVFSSIGQVAEALLGFCDDLGLGEMAATALGDAVNGLSIVVQAVADVFGFVATAVETVLSGFTSLCEYIWGGLTEAATYLQTIWDLIVALWPLVWESICNTLTEIWNGIVETVTTVFTTISETATNIWTGIQTVIETVVTAIATIIATVLGTIQTTWDSIWSAISTTASTIWDAISSTISSVIEAISSTISSVLDIISSTWSSVWGAVSDTASSIWSAISSTISSVLDTISSAISGALSTIKSTWSSAWDTVKEKVTTIWDGIVSGVENGMDTVVSTVKGIKTKVVNAVSDAGEWLLDAGYNICSGLVSGIQNGISTVTTAIKNVCTSAVSAAKDALGIGSPSKVFAEIGDWTMAGMTEGIEDGMDGVVSSVEDMVNGIVSAASGVDVTVALGCDVTGASSALQLVAAGSGGTGGGTTINQTFETKVVRSDADLYTAAPIIYRNAVREASVVSL